MKESYTASASIEILASTSKVWHALIDPKTIKEYLFGTTVVSDWKVGSSITYTGVWNGKPYEDKGKVIQNIPNKQLKTTYWSSLSNRPDVPENYNNVTYSLQEKDNNTILTVTKDNNPTKESATHSEQNWIKVLESMKAILEK